MRERAALAVIDADRAQGQLALAVATKKAASLALGAGVAWVSMRNTTHAGSIGYYARQLAEQHLIGIVLGASRPTMAYHGSRAEGVGTNPLAIAVPARNGRLLSFDMATSNASRGRVKLHAAAGRQLEPGWALTTDGEPTTDPSQAAVLTALGGPKGSGLSLMIETVTSVLAGAPLVEPTLRGDRGEHGQNAVVMALEIESFTDLATYLDDTDALIAAIKALPIAAGVDEVLLPGERGDRMAAARLADGLPLQHDTWERLTRLAERQGVIPPGSWPTKSPL
jgi:ureidoglycolate dehydrogenase (NAD+)